MNCTHCHHHSCRTLDQCSTQRSDSADSLLRYQETETQQVVQAAAHLVDHGRAGTLNRLQELAAYASERAFQHLGLAYCWGMEKEVTLIAGWLRQQGFRISAVSCTTGALAQDQVNQASTIHKVSCNPLSQAAQLNAEHVELVATIGLCLGHDMLLQQELQMPVTTLVVKDRTNGHHPLQAALEMIQAEKETQTLIAP